MEAELLQRFLGLETAVEKDEMLAGLSGEELLGLGVSLYNAGHYFEAHEAWEAVWLDSERELRAFYQGLIQVTAAFVHVTRGEYPGSVRLLAEGVEKLRRYPAWFKGVGIGELVEGAERARLRLVQLGARRVREFEMALVPRIEVRHGDGTSDGSSWGHE
jgi:predicted metal-dependent hydrolase